MTYFVKYDLETGLYSGSGNVPAEQLSIQAREGEGLLLSKIDPVVQAVVNGAITVALDFSGVVAALRDKIDFEAGAFRTVFITDIPGQAQTYEKKEAEARAWSFEDEAAHPERYPFILAEAEARSLPTSEVQQQILAQVNALVPVAARVEAARVAAKERVTNATALGEMAAGAVVDWESLIVP